jgi:hypothetical protein
VQDIIPPLLDLWHYGSQRCVITAPSDGPPFNVGLHDGEMLTLHIFLDHDTAATFAVEALRTATQRPLVLATGPSWNQPRIRA